MRTALITAVLMGSSLSAQDVLFLKNGERRAGEISQADGVRLRLQIPLPGAPGAREVFAAVWIPLSDIRSIEFSHSPELEELLRPGRADRLHDLASAWAAHKVWLSLPKSSAGRIGIAYASGLLQSGRLAESALAWQLFHEIEGNAWREDDRMEAKQGRLRAMVACGNAADALGEARELARMTENPAVLIEAKFLLAEADHMALCQLVAENPRWEDDVYVIPEHARLSAQALDQYLFPSLFFGTGSFPAARGLWGALQVYDFNRNQRSALECARDLVAWYPATPFGAQARDYIARLPAEVTRNDPERAARTPRPAAAVEKISKKKKPHEN